MKPDVAAFFDPRTSSLQYVVSDPVTRACAIIDPVLDFDEKSGTVTTDNADRLLDFVHGERLDLQWILDTHPHADHLSAADYLKTKTGVPKAIGANITAVQKLWAEIYNTPDLRQDGSQWDRLFADGDRFRIGNIEGAILFSPGHTLASITYLAGDCAFVHDTVFMPDGGTARTDFPGGSANALWKSIQGILALPGQTRLFVGHDYQPGGRELRWESTVDSQRTENIHLAKDPGEEAFVRFRQERDKTLPMPKLILLALQVNINAGRLPEPESNGVRYLKVPLNALKTSAF